MNLKCLGSGSNGNCYILDNGRHKLLLDCGIPFKEVQKALNYSLIDVYGCLMTHKHSDHSKCYENLLRYGVPIYTNDETAEHFGVVSGELLIGCKERKSIQIGTYSIVPFYLPHNSSFDDEGELIPCHNFGWLIFDSESREKLLYATDMECIPYRFTKQNIDHYLIECNHIHEMMDESEIKFAHSVRGHMALSTLVDFLKINVTDNCKNIILCHLSNGWSDEDEILNTISNLGFPANIDIAKRGREWKL